MKTQLSWLDCDLICQMLHYLERSFDEGVGILKKTANYATPEKAVLCCTSFMWLLLSSLLRYNPIMEKNSFLSWSS